MELKDALYNISVHKFYMLCGYSYQTLKHGKHDGLSYSELPIKMQNGLFMLIRALNRTQKMVYSYEIDFLSKCISDCGIKKVPFYRACGLQPTFHETLSLKKDRDNKLLRIRLELIATTNRLLEYVLE